MGLETGTYIEDLVPANPLGTDPKSQGDDHIRLVKSTIQNSFPNTTGPWNTTSPISAGAATQGSHLIRQDQILESYGRFDENAAILSGTGDFSVVRVQTGYYRITWDNPASVNAQNNFLVANGLALGAAVVNVVPVSTGITELACYSGVNGAVLDCEITFFRKYIV
jgi:hypothetical protein